MLALLLPDPATEGGSVFSFSQVAVICDLGVLRAS